MTLRVSAHAIERFQERIANLPAEEVVAALDTQAVRTAAEFGAPFVRLPTGQRIVIHDHTVITVLPAEHFRRQVHRHGLGRFGKSSHSNREDQHGEG